MMIPTIIGAVTCLAYTFIPARFYKLKIAIGLVISFVAFTFAFDFVSRPASDGVLPAALWIMAAYLWLKEGFTDFRLARKARKNLPK